NRDGRTANGSRRAAGEWPPRRARLRDIFATPSPQLAQAAGTGHGPRRSGGEFLRKCGQLSVMKGISMRKLTAIAVALASTASVPAFAQDVGPYVGIDAGVTLPHTLRYEGLNSTLQPVPTGAPVIRYS